MMALVQNQLCGCRIFNKQFVMIAMPSYFL